MKQTVEKDKPVLTGKDIWTSVGITIAFWATRLINLRLWPIFTDEAIYTRWSQIGLNDASLRFISLTDGKQPLWHWVTIAAMKVISDPLLAGRFVSVSAGFFAMIGIWLLAYELFGKKRIAFIAASLYVLVPFTLLYDRIALVDSMLSMWGIWVLYLGVKTAKSLRFDYAMLTGFALGAGLLTKSPAVFWQYLYPLNLLFIKEKKRIPRWILLVIPTMLIAEGMRNVLRLSPWMYIIGRKNLEFVTSFGEFLREPFRWFWGNLPSLWHWWLGSVTWPVMLVGIAGLAFVFLPQHHVLSLQKNKRAAMFLFIHALFPFLISAAFGKVIFARYLLFITPPLLLMAAAASQRIFSLARGVRIKIIFCLFLFVASAYMDYKILTDPVGAPIIQADRDQYVNGFPAGWGIDETIAFLKERALKETIFLGTQGTFGLMPASFELYLWDNPNIEIKGFWPVSAVPDEVTAKAEEKTTYFIYYESREVQIPPQDNLILWKKFRKGASDRFMYVYEVLPMVKNGK